MIADLTAVRWLVVVVVVYTALNMLLTADNVESVEPGPAADPNAAKAALNA